MSIIDSAIIAVPFLALAYIMFMGLILFSPITNYKEYQCHVILILSMGISEIVFIQILIEPGAPQLILLAALIYFTLYSVNDRKKKYEVLKTREEEEQ